MKAGVCLCNIRGPLRGPDDGCLDKSLNNWCDPLKDEAVHAEWCLSMTTPLHATLLGQ